MNYFNNTEKLLKSCLKERVKITAATVVGFLIMGTAVFAMEEIPQNPTIKVVAGQVNNDKGNYKVTVDGSEQNEVQTTFYGTKQIFEGLGITVTNGSGEEEGFDIVNTNIVLDGKEVREGGLTPSAISAGDTSSKKMINKGNIWVTTGVLGHAEAMGTQGSEATIINKGNIYVLDGQKTRVKAMGVNPGGKAINQGLIVVNSGSGIIDNSGSTEKTMINDENGKIIVEGSGVGIYHRKEAITNGSVENKGTIEVTGNGTGVLIANDKNEDSYNGKIFTNSGKILATGENSKAIYSTSKDFTLNLREGSHIEGLIKLLGSNSTVDIDGVGTADNPEIKHIEGTDTAVRVNNSNIILEGNIENKTYREDMKNYENNGVATYYGDTTVAINVTDLKSSLVTNNGTITGIIGIGTYDTKGNLGENGKITVINNGTIKASEYGIWHNVYENNKFNKMIISNDGTINVETTENSDAAYGIFAGGLENAKLSLTEVITEVENTGDIYVKNTNDKIETAKGIFIHSRTKGVNTGNITVESKGALGVYLLAENSDLPSGTDKTIYENDFNGFVNNGNITVIGENSRGIKIKNTSGFKSEVVNGADGIITVEGNNSIGVEIIGNNSFFANEGIISIGIDGTKNIAIKNDGGVAENSGIIQISDMTEEQILANIKDQNGLNDFVFDRDVTNTGMIVDKDGDAITFDGDDSVVGGPLTTDELEKVDSENNKVTIEGNSQLADGHNPAVTSLHTLNVNGDVTIVKNEDFTTEDAKVEIAADNINLDADGEFILSDGTTLSLSDGTLNKAESSDGTSDKTAIDLGENGTLNLNDMNFNGNIVGEGVINSLGENRIDGDIEGTFNIGTQGSVLAKVSSEKNNITVMSSESSFKDNVNIGTDGQLVLELGKDNKNVLSNSTGIIVTGTNNDDIALDLSNVKDGMIIDLGESNTFNNVDVTSISGEKNGVYIIDDSDLSNGGNTNDVILKYNKELYKENNSILNDMNNHAEKVDGKYLDKNNEEVRKSQLDKLYSSNIYSETVKAAYDNTKLVEDSILSLEGNRVAGEWTAEGKAIYSKNEYDRDGLVGDYSSKLESIGLLAALRYGLNDTTSVGFAFAGVKQDLDTDAGSSDGDVFYLGAFADKYIGNNKLTAGLGYQLGKYDSDNIAGNTSVSEEYDSNAFSAYVQAKHMFDLGDGLSLEPKAKLGYTYVDQDDVKDDYFGVKDAELSTVDAEVGFDLVKTVQLEKSKLDVTFGTAYVRAMGDTDNKFTGSFVGDNGTFDVLGAELAENTIKANLTAEVTRENGFFYNAGVTYRFGSDNTEDYGANVGVGYSF